MKILVIGGTGLIGTKVVSRLRAGGHDAVPASPSSGVDTQTGQGLDAAMNGVHVVIDLANSPVFDGQAVTDFFEAAGAHIVAAEKKAGVLRHVALSVVGTHRLAASDYFRGKLAQENVIRAGGIPFTIVRSTQFFEFLSGIAAHGTPGEALRLSDARIQPIASDDVADAVVAAALAEPVNGIVEIGGPDIFPLADLVRRYLEAVGDTRPVIADRQALYFGALLEDDTLVPGAAASLGRLDFPSWLDASRATHRAV